MYTYNIHFTTETHTTLENNYTPGKNFKKKKRENSPAHIQVLAVLQGQLYSNFLHSGTSTLPSVT